MNCPFHISIYKNGYYSYRDLPLRWAELGTVYRYERSGTMHGLFRVRGFTQVGAGTKRECVCLFCMCEKERATPCTASSACTGLHAGGQLGKHVGGQLRLLVDGWVVWARCIAMSTQGPCTASSAYVVLQQGQRPFDNTLPRPITTHSHSRIPHDTRPTTFQCAG